MNIDPKDERDDTVMAKCRSTRTVGGDILLFTVWAREQRFSTDNAAAARESYIKDIATRIQAADKQKIQVSPIVLRDIMLRVQRAHEDLGTARKATGGDSASCESESHAKGLRDWLMALKLLGIRTPNDVALAAIHIKPPSLLSSIQDILRRTERKDLAGRPGLKR